MIYYWGVRRAVMLMLAVYAKNEAEDLTQAQIKMLGEAVRQEFHDE
ncbi:MAG: addiction module toxin RelE [Acidiferrobacteraceae bacterium]